MHKTNKSFKGTSIKLTRRWLPLAVFFVLVLSLVLNSLQSIVNAYGLVTSRSIEMSSSAASATTVTYAVSFNAATSAVIQGLVVDFCSNDPIIGDSCTAPAGFTVGTPTVTGITGLDTTHGTWTAGSLNSGRTLTLTNGSASSTTTATTTVSFNITTVTNPSAANTSFYGRILDYTTTGGATGYTATSIGTPNDAGGVALSTANQITITAKVQEQLTFCVYTSESSAPCGSPTCTGTPNCSVALGNTNGVLSTVGPFVDKNTHYDLQTNASNGVTIRMTGNTLQSGSNSIAAIGSSAAASSAGTSQFGLCTYESSGANLTPSAPYNNANCSGTTQTAGTGSTGGAGTAQFAFNTTNTTSTYGDTIATGTAGPYSTGIIAFIGNISNTQVAGIYTTTLTFIATGSY